MKIKILKISPADLIKQLNDLSLVLYDSRATQLISQLKGSYQYQEHINEAIRQVASTKSDFILLDSYVPGKLVREWEKMLEVEQPLKDDDLSKLDTLAEKTRQSINNLMVKGFSPAQSSQLLQPRLINKEENDKKIKELQEQMETLQNESAKIDQLDEIKLQIEELKEQNKIKEDDDAKEKEWDKRIRAVFDDLSKNLEILNNEEDRAQIVYRWATGVLFVLIGVFSYFMYLLVMKTSSIEDPTYIQYVPWFTPLPFAVALFWVDVVFRNRASRHLMRIREEKFKIQYIEGLVKAINKTSLSFEEGAKNITLILNQMVNSYSRQIENSFIYESKKIERDTPVDASDIEKLCNKLTELIGKIKKS